VYATKDKGIALTFLQKWDDFLIDQSIIDGRHILTERLPNIFEEIYKGKGGFLYYLNSTNFLEGQTSFTLEVVSEHREKVLRCEAIDDCYAKLCEMEQTGEIVLNRYPNRPAHMPLDNSDLIKRTKRFMQNSQDKNRLVGYVIQVHPNLKEALSALLENH